MLAKCRGHLATTVGKVAPAIVLRSQNLTFRMSSLDVTLDSLIEAKIKNDRGGGRGGGGGRGNKRNSGGRGGSSSQFQKPVRQSNLDRSEPARSTTFRVAAYTEGGHSRRAEEVSKLRQPFDNKDPPRQSQNQGVARKERVQHTPVPIASIPLSGASSIFDRLGGGSASGTSVTIQKLNKDILPSDISELCVTIGEVKSVNMQYDSAGQSTGRADVTFSKRSDAVSCVQRFHNVALDGTPMQVQLTGEPAGIAVSNDSAPSASFLPVREAKNSNVREGLFGTAFDRNGGNEGVSRERERKAPKDTSFSVTMRGTADINRNVNQAPNQGRRRDEHDDRGDDAMPASDDFTTLYPSFNKGSSSGGRGQGRGGGRKGGAGGGRGPRGGDVKEADLDNAMDAYMSNK
jgi:RNA recognition motif. (a.k.a. RRM, RBD, or RNP domain)/C-terminal duplication domain of Friend of PRMT1